MKKRLHRVTTGAAVRRPEIDRNSHIQGGNHTACHQNDETMRGVMRGW